MSAPKTLLEMAGAGTEPPALGDCALVLIDCQMEYVNGRAPLAGVGAALAEAARLLEAARERGTPVIRIVHHGPSGGLFAEDGFL